MNEKRCNAKVWVWDGWVDVRCSKPPKVERNGVWYCTIHDPEYIARKDAERQVVGQEVSMDNLSKSRELAGLGQQGDKYTPVKGQPSQVGAGITLTLQEAPCVKEHRCIHKQDDVSCGGCVNVVQLAADQAAVSAALLDLKQRWQQEAAEEWKENVRMLRQLAINALGLEWFPADADLTNAPEWVKKIKALIESAEALVLSEGGSHAS